MMDPTLVNHYGKARHREMLEQAAAARLRLEARDRGGPRRVRSAAMAMVAWLKGGATSRNVQPGHPKTATAPDRIPSDAAVRREA